MLVVARHAERGDN
jgi:broad specificity phosphatase PhoE